MVLKEWNVKYSYDNRHRSKYNTNVICIYKTLLEILITCPKKHCTQTRSGRPISLTSSITTLLLLHFWHTYLHIR